MTGPGFFVAVACLCGIVAVSAYVASECNSERPQSWISNLIQATKLDSKFKSALVLSIAFLLGGVPVWRPASVFDE